MQKQIKASVASSSLCLLSSNFWFCRLSASSCVCGTLAGTLATVSERDRQGSEGSGAFLKLDQECEEKKQLSKSEARTHLRLDSANTAGPRRTPQKVSAASQRSSGISLCIVKCSLSVKPEEQGERLERLAEPLPRCVLSAYNRPDPDGPSAVFKGCVAPGIHLFTTRHF